MNMIFRAPFLMSALVGAAVAFAVALITMPPSGGRLSFLWQSISPGEGTGKPTKAEPRISKEEKALRELLIFIDELSLPEDPSRPASVVGVSDADLGTMAPEHVRLLLEQAHYVAKQPDAARRLFNLGRVADVHGYVDFANQLFAQAAELGSAPAKAYIADGYLEQNQLSQALSLLQEAVQGGFAPAQPLMKAVRKAIQEEQQAAQQRTAMDFDQFNRPDIIRALYRGDVSGLNRNLLESTVYVSTLHKAWSDNEVIFLVENRNILLEVDPKVGHLAELKLMSSPQGTQELANAGLQSFWGIISSMLNVRERGGTVTEEVRASMEATLNSPIVKLDVLKRQASQDARRLAIMYDSNPEAFRKVYAGIRKFVGS